MNSLFTSLQILPQYGSVSLPDQGSFVPLVGRFEEWKLNDQPVLVSEYDSLFKTSPQALRASTHLIGARRSFETLQRMQSQIWQVIQDEEQDEEETLPFVVESPVLFRDSPQQLGSDSQLHEDWWPGRYLARSHIALTNQLGHPVSLKIDVDRKKEQAKLTLEENGLSLSLLWGQNQVGVEKYEFTVSPQRLKDFLFASLAHYDGVDAELLQGDDLLLLAANLMFHQQFVLDAKEKDKQDTETNYDFQGYATKVNPAENLEQKIAAGILEEAFVKDDDGNLLLSAQYLVSFYPGTHQVRDEKFRFEIVNPDFENAFPLRFNVLELARQILTSQRNGTFIDLLAGSVGR